MLVSKASNVVSGVSLKPNCQRILPVYREMMPNGDTPTRSERKVFAESFVLIQKKRKRVGLKIGLDLEISHSQTADLSARRHISFQQCRRDGESVRDVV